MRNAAWVAAPVLIPRAVVVWTLVRLMFAVLPMAIGAPFGSMSPPPVAVIFLAGIVGLIDIHVRRERILWGNLGVTSTVVYAMYAGAAVPAEFLLALALR